jgi:hypothetical protein
VFPASIDIVFWSEPETAAGLNVLQIARIDHLAIEAFVRAVPQSPPASDVTGTKRPQV